MSKIRGFIKHTLTLPILESWVFLLMLGVDIVVLGGIINTTFPVFKPVTFLIAFGWGTYIGMNQSKLKW